VNKHKRNIIIGVAVAAGVLTIGYFMAKLAGKAIRGAAKKAAVRDFVTEKEGSAIITVPKSNFKHYDIVVVYGGISFATPTFMLNELKSSTAKNLLYSNIFIFVPYTNKWGATSSLIDKMKGKYNVGDVSLIGYSAGGTDVQDVYSPDYKFFGLIDPSTACIFSENMQASEEH
jgi:hypothetical protein